MGLIVFVVGAILGSFLNVVIYRLPRGMSLLHPPSHCPVCGHRIMFYDNIPIISYILLRGKCRYCGARISPRYFLVELLSALLLLFLYLKFGFSLSFLEYAIFALLLVALSFIDLDLMILPNKLTYPGIAAGFLLSTIKGDFLHAILGAIVGYIIGLVLYYGGAYVFRKEAFGGGDVKLLAMIGSFLGPANVALTLFLGSIVGSIVGLLLRKKKIPFGPFLAVGALISLFFGKEILSLWLG